MAGFVQIDIDSSPDKIFGPIRDIPKKIHDTLPEGAQAVLHMADIKWEWNMERLCWYLRLVQGICFVDSFMESHCAEDEELVARVAAQMWEHMRAGGHRVV